MPPKPSPEEQTDTRPLAVARTLSAVTIAGSALAYVMFKIFVCGCMGG